MSGEPDHAVSKDKVKHNLQKYVALIRPSISSHSSLAPKLTPLTVIPLVQRRKRFVQTYTLAPSVRKLMRQQVENDVSTAILKKKKKPNSLMCVHLRYTCC